MKKRNELLTLVGILVWILFGPVIISLSYFGLLPMLNPYLIAFLIFTSFCAFFYCFMIFSKNIKKSEDKNKEDEGIIDTIEEILLRKNLILTEIRGVCDQKGIDEERLKSHCSYFMGGKGLGELNLEEVILLRSYIKSQNEVKNTRSDLNLS